MSSVKLPCGPSPLRSTLENVLVFEWIGKPDEDQLKGIEKIREAKLPEDQERIAILRLMQGAPFENVLPK